MASRSAARIAAADVLAPGAPRACPPAPAATLDARQTQALLALRLAEEGSAADERQWSRRSSLLFAALGSVMLWSLVGVGLYFLVKT